MALEYCCYALCYLSSDPDQIRNCPYTGVRIWREVCKDVRVNTGMKKVKSLVVRWAWAAWNKLKRKQELVKEGWGRCGMADVLDAAFQRDALMSGFDNREAQEGVEEDDQVGADSDDDEEEDEDGAEAEGPALTGQTD